MSKTINKSSYTIGKVRFNKTNEEILLKERFTESHKYLILEFERGDGSNMLETLKANPQVNRGDWYSKMIHFLEEWLKSKPNPEE